MKKYKIKVTKTLLKKLKPYWKEVQRLENDYYIKLTQLEENMSKKLKINNLEFIHCNGIVGIGNVERTIRLIHDSELKYA